MHAGMLYFKENAEKRTQGVLEIQLFPAALLGTPEDYIEQAAVGSNILGFTDAGRLGPYVPDFAVIGGSYLVNNFEELAKMWDTQTYKELGREFEKHNLKFLAFRWYEGQRNVFSKKKATTPAEMKGIMMRSSGSEIVSEYVRCLGANPVVVAMSEVYSALQQGVVDAVEQSYSGALGASVHEQAKYIIGTRHVYHTTGPVTSLKWWNALPKEYQVIVDEELNKGADVCNKATLETEEKNKQSLIAAGMEYVEVNVEVFRKNSMPLYEKLKLKEIYNKFMKEMGKPTI